MALCGQNYQTRNGVCDILVCMKVLRFQYCAAERVAPSCDDFATRQGAEFKMLGPERKVESEA